jgi:hypothetical protein
MHEIAFTRKESHDCNDCPHDIQLHDLSMQSDKIDKFIMEAEPLLDYVRAEIERNRKRAEFYSKITEHVLGTAILAVLGYVGHWFIEKIKNDFGLR